MILNRIIKAPEQSSFYSIFNPTLLSPSIVRSIMSSNFIDILL